MLFTVVVILFAIGQTVKLIAPWLLDTNVVFYMMAFLFCMALMHLTRGTFSQGWFSYSDETKIEILFAIKSAVASFVALKSFGSTAFFDFNIEKAHDESLVRVNSVMSLLGGKLNLPHDFTYGVLSLGAAVLTFATVRINIRFAYYFYVLTKNSATLLASRSDNTPEQVRYRRHLYLMYLNMLAPLLIAVFYLTPLVETLIVPDLLSESVWRLGRMVFVVGTVCLRLVTFREEVQFHFNESYFYVQKLMTDKNEKIFRYIKLRIQENFLATWYAVFQHSCNYALPILLVLAHVNRIVAFSTLTETELSFPKAIEKMRSVPQYDVMGDSEALGQIFQEMSQKGLLTVEMYDCFYNYMIFWYYFSSTVVALFSLLYYRKFVGQ